MDKSRMEAVNRLLGAIATEVYYGMNMRLVLAEYYDKAPAEFDMMYQLFVNRLPVERGAK